MKTKNLILTLALGLITTPLLAADYKIDPAHSFITFRVKHLNMSWTHGRFNDVSGEFTYDSNDPSARKILVRIDPASVDTNHAERDKEVRENFLQTSEFSAASFESTQYSGGDEEGVLEGILTLHGVAKPISVEVKKINEGKDPWGNYRAGFSGRTSIERSDWDVAEMGPDPSVEFEITIEGVRQ